VRGKGKFNKQEYGYSVFIPRNCTYMDWGTSLSINFGRNNEGAINGSLDIFPSKGAQEWDKAKADFYSTEIKDILKNNNSAADETKMKKLNGMDCIIYSFSKTYEDGTKETGYTGLFKTKKGIFQLKFGCTSKSVSSSGLKMIKSIRPL